MALEIFYEYVIGYQMHDIIIVNMNGNYIFLMILK